MLIVVLSNSLFGFLLGSTVAGGGIYSYVLQEYKASNELLTEDIYVCSVPCMRVVDIPALCRGGRRRRHWR